MSSSKDLDVEEEEEEEEGLKVGDL